MNNTSTRGILMHAIDRPLITRAYNVFTSGIYTGAGRWGMFMEPAALTLGIPFNVAALTRFQIANYNLDSTINTVFLTILSTNGNVGIGIATPTTTLDISGTFKTNSTGTIPNLFTTNITSTTIIATNITTTNVISTNISSANSVITNSTTNSILLNTTTNASNSTSGGPLTSLGGGAIAKDLYVGQNLYVNGQNISSRSNTTTIGNYNGTGVYSISNILIGTTMGNTSYKIIGNLQTTSTVSNVYTVSFSNITNFSFNANILRIDSLFSGWTDPTLVLSWNIIP
jgi:hypothetical protein